MENKRSVETKRSTDYICEKCSHKVYVIMHEVDCSDEYGCLCRRTYFGHACSRLDRKTRFHSEYCNGSHIDCSGREFRLALHIKESSHNTILNEYAMIYESHTVIEEYLLSLISKHSNLSLEYDRYKECHPENKKIFDHMIELGQRYANANSKVQQQQFIIQELENQVIQWKEKVKGMDHLYTMHLLVCTYEAPSPFKS